MKKAILNNGLIIPILIFQFFPLVLFPISSFKLTSQEWWLPVLLAIFSLWGSIELVFRKNANRWPWDLISFAQGFNIISRLLMIMPNISVKVGNANVFNTEYVVITFVSMIISTFLLWYFGQPEVTMGLLAKSK